MLIWFYYLERFILNILYNSFAMLKSNETLQNFILALVNLYELNKCLGSNLSFRFFHFFTSSDLYFNK